MSLTLQRPWYVLESPAALLTYALFGSVLIWLLQVSFTLNIDQLSRMGECK